MTAVPLSFGMPGLSVWSVVLGVLLGSAYCLASLITWRIARRGSHHRFLLIFLGGMLARLFGSLALVVVILTTVSVSGPVFIGSFLAVYVVGMVLEIGLIYRSVQLKRSDDAGVRISEHHH